MRIKHILENPVPSPRPAKRESPDSSGTITPPSPSSDISNPMPDLVPISEYTSPYFTDPYQNLAATSATSSGGVLPIYPENRSILATEDVDTGALLSVIAPDVQTAQATGDNVELSTASAAQGPDYITVPPASSSTAQATSQSAAPGPTVEIRPTTHCAPLFQPTIYKLSHLPTAVPKLPEHTEQFFRSSTVIVPVWTNYDATLQTWFRESDARFSSCGKFNLSPREHRSVSQVLKINNAGENGRLFGNIRFDVGTAFRTLSTLEIVFLRDAQEEDLERKRGLFVQAADGTTVIKITSRIVDECQQVRILMRRVAAWLEDKMQGWSKPDGLSMEEMEIVADLFVVRADTAWMK
jgi:hypothetical protein